MISVVRQHVKTIICLGDNIEPIKNALGCLMRDGIIKAETLEDAMRIAMNKVVAGDSVIFSPGSEIDGFDAMKLGKAFVKMAK